jgi:murein L,D-transpeptidase YcbB/YkuD
MKRLTGSLIIGMLATILSAAWAPRERAGADSTDVRAHSSAAEPGRQADAGLRVLFEAAGPPEYVLRDGEGSRLWGQARTFYEKRQFTPAWIDSGSPGRQMEALVSAVAAAHEDGLDPEAYGARLLADRQHARASGPFSKTTLRPDDAAALDAYLTYVYMKLASDLADGVSDPARADPAWTIARQTFDPLSHLERALEERRVFESLRELTPDAPDYLALRDALARHRAEASRGGWPTVPERIRLEPGQVSADVAAVARRLVASRDYAGALPADDRPAVYTPELQEAVKRFQRRHGLADDGVVGPASAAEMNVPAEARIRQIELSLERWRWLPRDLGARHILVNIPEMRMDVRDRGKVALTMRTVVGKRDTPTPIFSEYMTYLVFSPYWNVPPGIASTETLPSALADPDFLARTNMEVLDSAGSPVDPALVDLADPAYRFRQRPGGTNSLGLVKFMFPNPFNVYLHDTPADSLFARAGRAFSHGCVRLEEPRKLAEYLLQDQPEWTAERIDEAMQSGEERTVALRDPVPVYIGYWTAGVSGDGVMQFRKDVYGLDAPATAALAERLYRQRAGASFAAAMLTGASPTATLAPPADAAASR